MNTIIVYKNSIQCKLYFLPDLQCNGLTVFHKKQYFTESGVKASNPQSAHNQHTEDARHQWR